MMNRLGSLGRIAVAVAVCTGVIAVVTGTARASNDPMFDRQWALDRIEAPDAWRVSTGDGVLVGVVDTGVDLRHEDLAGQIAASTNCIGASGDPGRCGGSAQDDNGHGTHVAGIIAAAADNSRGISGTAPDARLVVAKGLDGEGEGTVSDISAGIRWVVDRGARVVNLSLGDPNFFITSTFGTSLRPAIDYAWSRGAVTVLSSGNANLFGIGIGSSDYGDIPAVVVGASGPNDEPAAYSSPTGDARWALVAPGGIARGDDSRGVLSTYWQPGATNSYEALMGTSMAAPHVSGAAALLLARGLGPQATVTRLLDGADDGVGCGPNSPTCRGRLDAAASLAGTAPRTTTTTSVEGSATTTTARPSTTSTTSRTEPGDTTTTTERSTTTTTSAPRGDGGRSGGGTTTTTEPPPREGREPSPRRAGYWLAAADGGVFAFGDAAFHGSTGNIDLAEDIVALATTPTGNGYWLAAADGGVFAFGDAAFHGSTGNIDLAEDIVALATTPTGNGYWLAAADGGVFAFGDAAFHGSTGNIDLVEPITSMAPADGGLGYWLVAEDGGVFAFGAAKYHGAAAPSPRPVRAAAVSPGGAGYWLADDAGRVHPFGDAAMHGQLTVPPRHPVVAMGTSG